MRPPPDTAKASPEEERLRSLILSLQTESAILERLVYKNKNQHRRCPYFQALLKVRRDVRLLQSAGLGEILHVLIPIIDGRKPAKRAYVTMRLKRKHPSGKHNYQERLLGVARLLSQMAEPILKILLDVVSVFNKVSSLLQKKQSVKLIGEGIEAFREYYPSSGDAHHTLTLECVWEEDKFVLFERTNNIDRKKSDEDQGAVPSEAPIQYETMDLFNEGDDSNRSLTSVQSSDEDMSSVKTQNDTARDLEPIDPSINLSSAESEMHGVAVEITHCEDERKTSVSKSGMDVGSAPRKKKVAFVSVSKPKLSDTNTNASNKKMKLDLLTNDADATKAVDPFLSLLLGGCTNKNRLF